MDLYGAIIDYNSAFVYTPASGLTTTKSNEDLKVLFRLTTHTHCLKLHSQIRDKAMEILNRRNLMKRLTPNVLPHSPHMLPQRSKFQEI